MLALIISKLSQSLFKQRCERLLINGVTWLTGVLKEGQKSHSIRSDLKAEMLSQMIYSQIMGAQLQAKVKNDPDLILEAANGVIALISRESKT